MNVAAVTKLILNAGMSHVSVYEGSRISEGSKAAFCTADYTEDVDRLSAQEAARLFEEFMEDAFPGKYVARLMKGAKGGAGARQLVFEKPGAAAAPSGIAGSGADAVGAIARQIEEKFNAKLEAFRLEHERKEMQKRIGALEEELEAARQPGARLVTFGEWAIGHFLEQASLRQVAGTPQLLGTEDSPGESEEDSGEDLNSEASRLLNIIAGSLGDDTILLLRKLAALPPDALQALARVDQHKINLALSFLK
ncbi:MAG: hypothetical protein NW241_10870 [Bacteroidia bacterium]|nr:hypothetical protein [Bacteroidia bacterium]